ncbi:MAG: bifunctional nuclease family protein [Treponema sp.]|jgi:bifunctional DNase/RNase|nr:bifunctional nuclease family protein [Treponema sp.]
MYKKREATLWTITRKGQGGLVVLKLMDGDLVIPFFASLDEVQSIVKGYDVPVFNRLGMHDLLLELVQQMGLALLRVELYAIKDNILHTKLFFSRKVPEKEGAEHIFFSVQGRPADAVALAVRSKCPLYVSQGVIEQVGVPVGYFTEGIERCDEEWLDIPRLIREPDYTGSETPVRRDILVVLGAKQGEQVP